nr:probable galacturonosyltransferase-like 4 [Ipomoea trifida]
MTSATVTEALELVFEENESNNSRALSSLIFCVLFKEICRTLISAQKVLAAPEYCHANFTVYFTEAFWADPELGTPTFQARKPCYSNTGVMVVDVEKWRQGEFTKKVEDWMMVLKQKRIYHLGSLPPFLLVFAGNIMPVDHRWNQHGLGGDNIEGKCRSLI